MLLLSLLREQGQEQGIGKMNNLLSCKGGWRYIKKKTDRGKTFFSPAGKNPLYRKGRYLQEERDWVGSDFFSKKLKIKIEEEEEDLKISLHFAVGEKCP